MLIHVVLLPCSVPEQSRTTAAAAAPVPGMRFDPSVGDIAEVTSPPYDVMDRQMIDELLDGHPRNIVRLILPWMVSDPVRATTRTRARPLLLARWRAKGLLVTDPRPALYVYEYGDERARRSAGWSARSSCAA